MSEVATVPDDERARLEREREFLLRSLDDLDRERDKGAIDDESYARLHDDYTARAAAVIRSLEQGVDVRPVAPPTSTRRRVLTVVGILVFAAAVAVVLAAALGARLPGDTSSGNASASRATGGSSSGSITVGERTKRLQERVAANPDDLASRLLLARFLEARGDLPGALEQYDEVLGRDATSAEAEAQAGRILYLTAQAAVKSNADAVDGLVQQSRTRLDHAVQLDPNFADAHFFRAIVLANEFGDFATAQNDLQRYLVLAPQGQFAVQARQLLAEVTNALDGTPIATAPPPSSSSKSSKPSTK